MKVVKYKNLSIYVSADISDDLAKVILERAANKQQRDCYAGEMTLSDAVEFRSNGENYQLCDTVATRAFEHELEKHLRPNP